MKFLFALVLVQLGFTYVAMAIQDPIHENTDGATLLLPYPTPDPWDGNTSAEPTH